MTARAIQVIWGGGKQGGEQAQYAGHTVLEKACKAQPVAHPLIPQTRFSETEGKANFDGLNFEPQKGFLFLPRPHRFPTSKPQPVQKWF